MSSPFGDDAEFPDRPDTLDFWRLSQVVLGLDASAQEGKDALKVLDGVIDAPSLAYTTEQRIQSILQAVSGGHSGLVALNPVALLESVFMSGVVIGIKFEKEGGHRDG